MAQTVTVNIVGDASSLDRALNGAQSSLQSFGAKAKSVGEQATSIGRSMTFGVTLPLVALGKVAFEELTSSAAASAQTAAAIKSTGGAANVSAEQIDRLSSSLLKKSGVDDEIIKGGANVLLTFKAIKNEAGAGNDIFNQATKATLDLSVAFGKDMTSSAILVGKALQDPIAGVSALRRVGVQLTDQQVESIKAFVEQGDIMSAQKVILQELTSEVGGSAEAYGKSFAGQVSKANEELKNAGAAILASVIPALQDLTDLALSAAEGFSKLPEPVKQAAVGFGVILAAVGPLTYVFGSLSKLAGGAATVVKGLADGFKAASYEIKYFGLVIQEVGIGTFIAEIGLLAAAIALPAAALAGLGFAIDAVFGIDSTGRGSFGQVLDALDKGRAKGANWADTIIAGAKASANPLDELRARLNSLRASRDAEAAASREGGLTQEQAAEAYGRYSTAIERTKGAIADTKKALEESKAAEAAHKQNVEDLATGTTNWATATEDAKRAILDLQDAIIAQSGGALGLRQAQLNLTKAQEDYNKALADWDPSNDAQAELDLEQARLAVAAATDKAQDSTLDLINTVKQGPDAVQALINKKQDEIKNYGDSSGAIQEQIDKLVALNNFLNGMPTQKGIQLDLSVAGIEALNYTKDTINDLTSTEHRVMVELGGDALGYLTASDRNIKRNITPIRWN